MKLTHISEDIYQYEFIEETDHFFALNITVVIDGNKALIIDAGYEEQAEKVRDDLLNKGIKPEIVILSHFHPDHIVGAKKFGQVQFIGSKHYQINTRFTKKFFPDHELVEPNILVEDTKTIIFGIHQIKLLHTPGHSICSLSTVIDNKLIHVGDLVMFSKDGKTMLPFIGHDGSVDEHITSLEKIKEMDISSMLLSHGPYISNREQMKSKIDDILYYLKSLKKNKEGLELKDHLKYDIENYSAFQFHEKNLKQLAK